MERTSKHGKEPVKPDKIGKARISSPEVNAMIGHIVPGAGDRLLVRLTREEIYGLPLLRGETPGDRLTVRRVRRTAAALRKKGVVRALAPEGFPFWETVLKQGLRPVETGELCRALAAPIALAALEGEGIPPHLASVLLRGERVTRALRAAALELCPRVRQLLVEAPAGGEALRQQLRQEFGLPAVEGHAGREVHLTLCFSRPDGTRPGRTADLSGETPAPAGCRFGLRQGALPEDAAALPLLSVLWTSGRLERDEISVTPIFALDRPEESTYNTG